jgi:hypothetical protein
MTITPGRAVEVGGSVGRDGVTLEIVWEEDEVTGACIGVCKTVK